MTLVVLFWEPVANPECRSTRSMKPMAVVSLSGSSTQKRRMGYGLPPGYAVDISRRSCSDPSRHVGKMGGNRNYQERLRYTPC
jgi:hypothetical protein